MIEEFRKLTEQTELWMRDRLDREAPGAREKAEALLAELYSKLVGNGLRPRTVVCYDREAFSYPPGNVRITLDRNVRSGLGSLDFLNPQARYVPVMEGLTVLEVKYDAFLPELIRMAVQVPNRRAAACSKYALCRRYD